MNFTYSFELKIYVLQSTWLFKKKKSKALSPIFNTQAEIAISIFPVR